MVAPTTTLETRTKANQYARTLLCSDAHAFTKTQRVFDRKIEEKWVRRPKVRVARR
jgi:hypothetical protein